MWLKDAYRDCRAWCARVWWSEGCQSRRITMLRGLAPAFLLVFAAFLGWWLSRPIDERWAKLDKLEAKWVPSRRVLQIRLEFTKEIGCYNVIVSKHIAPVIEGQVYQTNPIPLEGTLNQQMATAPVGQTVELWDGAKMKTERDLPYEKYLLTVSASCQDRDAELGDDSLIALPVTTTVFMPKSEFLP